MHVNAKHLLDGYEYVPTTKRGKPGTLVNPIAIIMHYTSGYTTRGDVDTLTRALDDGGREASAHVVIGRDGEVIQCVPFNCKAWHAGPSAWVNPLTDEVIENFNSRAIGIENSNAGYLEKVLMAGTDTRNKFKDYHGNYIWGDGSFVNGKRNLESAPDTWLMTPDRHPVIGKKNLVWEPFYDAQLAALDEVTAALLKAYPSIKYILTHEEIDTRGWKSDPGPAFPLRHYTKMTESRADDGDEPTDDA